METFSHNDECLQCDQCDYRANFKKNLRKHKRNHQQVIPQLDGLEDVKTSEAKSVQSYDPEVMESGRQTEYHKFKELEVQTVFTDTTTCVTVKWG